MIANCSQRCKKNYSRLNSKLNGCRVIDDTLDKFEDSYRKPIEAGSIDQTLNTAKIIHEFWQIDLSAFNRGVFFITIRSKDSVVTEKIIKL